MGNYKEAFRITIINNEGGYNPGIGENETYKGIDRGANPKWSGWKIIDAIKAAKPKITVRQMNVSLAANAELQADIYNFYMVNYWLPVKLDQVNDVQLANNLFDCSVNQGEGIARLFLQLACNKVIADTGSKLTPLFVDKVIGPKTLEALKSLPPELVHNDINTLREARYRNSRGFGEWGEIWLARLKEYKK